LEKVKTEAAITTPILYDYYSVRGSIILTWCFIKKIHDFEEENSFI